MSDTTYKLEANGTSQVIHTTSEWFNIVLGEGLTADDLRWAWSAGSAWAPGYHVLELTGGRGQIELHTTGSPDDGIRPTWPHGLMQVFSADGQDLTPMLMQAMATQTRQILGGEGTAANDLIWGYDSSAPSGAVPMHSVDGRGGDDTLVAMPADTPVLLSGGAGSDTYLLLGDWTSAWTSDDAGDNVVRFGETWRPEDIQWFRNDLGHLVAVAPAQQAGARERGLVNTFTSAGPAGALRFEFASQPGLTIWAEDALRRATPLDGSPAFEVATASALGLSLATPGNDVLVGSELTGGQGDDRLQLDTPPGAVGTVHYSLGDGNDLVYGDTSAKTIVFGAGITPAMLHVQFNSYASGQTATDSVRIGFAGHLGRLDVVGVPSLQFDDGTRLGADEVLALALRTPIVTDDAGEVLILSAMQTPLDIRGGAGNDTLYGGQANDTIDGGLGDSTVAGGAGDDQISVHGWYDSVTGGLGRDTIDVFGSAVIDVRGDGADLVNLHDGAGATVLLGKGDAADAIASLATQQPVGRINLVLAADIARGSVVVDRSNPAVLALVSKPDGSVIARLPEGLDYHVYFESDHQAGCTLEELGSSLTPLLFAHTVGTAAADKLVGDARRASVLLGLGGDDTLLASTTSTTPALLADGGAGNDLIVGSTMADSLIGGLGNDTLQGGDDADTLVGDVGDDLLVGGAGADTYLMPFEAINGSAVLAGSAYATSAGNDTLFADNEDTLRFTTPVDFARLALSVQNGQVVIRHSAPSAAGMPTSITLAGTQDWRGLQLVDSEGHRLSGADLLARVSQTVQGDDSANLINGFAGRDALFGNGGNDSLIGGDGDDTLVGGLGNDLVQGGAGNDQLPDGGGDDTMLGGDGDDFLQAAFGNDVLDGGEGSDRLEVVAGNETSATRRIQVHMTAADILQFAGLTLDDPTHRTYDVQADELSLGLRDERSGQAAGQLVITHFTDAMYARFWTGGQADPQLMMDVFNSAGQRNRGTEAADTLQGYGGRDTLDGLGGDDSLSGGWDDDELNGGAGNDTLLGGWGNDVLRGQGGVNWLQGDGGADRYVLAAGDVGNVIVADGEDRVELAFTKAQMSIQRQAADGSVTVNFGGTAVAPSASFKVLAPNGIDTFTLQFSDGSTLLWKDVLAEATKPLNLTLNGTAGADKLTGGAGNDTLNGLAGNDSLVGGAGQDSLNGGLGNDTMAGGLGRDTLVGAAGNDTYLFARGDGQDLIVDKDSTLNNNDLLAFANAKSTQLWFTRSGNNLDVAIIGTTDKVSIQDWFLSTSNRIEKFTASDGKSLTAAKVGALVSAMSGFTNQAMGGTDLGSGVPSTVTKLISSSWTTP